MPSFSGWLRKGVAEEERWLVEFKSLASCCPKENISSLLIAKGSVPGEAGCEGHQPILETHTVRRHTFLGGSKSHWELE